MSTNTNYATVSPTTEQPSATAYRCVICGKPANPNMETVTHDECMSGVLDKMLTRLMNLKVAFYTDSESILKNTFVFMDEISDKDIISWITNELDLYASDAVRIHIVKKQMVDTKGWLLNDVGPIVLGHADHDYIRRRESQDAVHNH